MTGDQQALVSLEITDAGDRPQPLGVVLDTGFTGYLPLSTETIQQFRLLSVGRRTFEPANREFFDFGGLPCVGVLARTPLRMRWCSSRIAPRCWV